MVAVVLHGGNGMAGRVWSERSGFCSEVAARFNWPRSFRVGAIPQRRGEWTNSQNTAPSQAPIPFSVWCCKRSEVPATTPATERKSFRCRRPRDTRALGSVATSSFVPRTAKRSTQSQAPTNGFHLSSNSRDRGRRPASLAARSSPALKRIKAARLAYCES